MFHIITDEQGVLGLPLRLTVSLIIGIVALAAILSFIMNPCLLPKTMAISVNPMVGVLSNESPVELTFTVFVNDSTGHAVNGASVLIKGLGGAGSNFTDNQGKAIVYIQVSIEKGSIEGYLAVIIKSSCYCTYSQSDLIKIIKLSR